MPRETPQEVEERIRFANLLNERAWERERLEQEYGQVWDTEQLQDDFEVLTFLAPMCLVRRLSDGRLGGMLFQHQPRYYFSFTSDEEDKP